MSTKYYFLRSSAGELGGSKEILAIISEGTVKHIFTLWTKNPNAVGSDFRPVEYGMTEAELQARIEELNDFHPCDDCPDGDFYSDNCTISAKCKLSYTGRELNAEDAILLAAGAKREEIALGAIRAIRHYI